MALTHKRDLRTGKPVWLAHGLAKLSIDKSVSAKAVDVVIVGTGISGALVADALINAGFSVLAVDRRQPMTGSTPASTALLQSELDTPLVELQRKLGKSNAARVWLRSAQAVQALRDRIEDLNIACDFIPRSTLYLPGNVLDADGLQRETEARRKLGLRSTYIGRTPLLAMSGIRKMGAIHTEGNAEADPAKLVAGLWRNFLAAGGHMVADVEITAVDQTRSQVRLETADGRYIRAKHVAFCTGYELMKFAQPKGYKVISSWVLATKPQPRNLWKSRSLIWEAADPYLYLRTTRDGRVIAGGEDEPFSDADKRDALIPEKIGAIARKAKKMFPQADFEAEFAWAGCFGESPTGLPAVGPIHGLSRCYAVLGFGGNGITFSMLAAQLVSRHIQNIKDPDAELFDL
jgi:glycine/D-amino acid oxidase-like deaminating enzyme